MARWLSLYSLFIETYSRLPQPNSFFKAGYRRLNTTGSGEAAVSVRDFLLGNGPRRSVKFFVASCHPGCSMGFYIQPHCFPAVFFFFFWQKTLLDLSYVHLFPGTDRQAPRNPNHYTKPLLPPPIICLIPSQASLIPLSLPLYRYPSYDNFLPPPPHPYFLPDSCFFPTSPKTNSPHYPTSLISPPPNCILYNHHAPRAYLFPNPSRTHLHPVPPPLSHPLQYLYSLISLSTPTINSGHAYTPPFNPPNPSYVSPRQPTSPLSPANHNQTPPTPQSHLNHNITPLHSTGYPISLHTLYHPTQRP